MITQYVTDSPEALAAIASLEPKHAWINGSITLIYTGEDYAPPAVPTQVEMAQARLALLQTTIAPMPTNLLVVVTSRLAEMTGAQGEAARTEFEYRSFVDRSSPLVQALAADIPLTDAQLDALFTLAATL